MTATREAPPALEYVYPDCPICGESVDHDGDSFYCGPCDAYWPDDHGAGAWGTDGEQCGSTHQHLARNRFAEGKPYQFDALRCRRTAEHAPPHRFDALTSWTDETAVSGLGPASEATS